MVHIFLCWLCPFSPYSNESSRKSLAIIFIFYIYINIPYIPYICAVRSLQSDRNSDTQSSRLRHFFLYHHRAIWFKTETINMLTIIIHFDEIVFAPELCEHVRKRTMLCLLLRNELLENVNKKHVD